MLSLNAKLKLKLYLKALAGSLLIFILFRVVYFVETTSYRESAWVNAPLFTLIVVAFIYSLVQIFNSSTVLTYLSGILLTVIRIILPIIAAFGSKFIIENWRWVGAFIVFALGVNYVVRQYKLHKE